MINEHEDEILDVLESFLLLYNDHEVNLNIEDIRNDRIYLKFKKLYEEIEQLNNQKDEFKQEIEELEGQIETLEEEIDFLNSNNLVLPKIDGNDNFKKNIISKAFNKYSLQELEQKLELDYLEL